MTEEQEGVLDRAERVLDRAERDRSRTIVDPPATLIRFSIIPDPGRGFTQAVLYFEADTEALRWLAQSEHPTPLSMHRLAPRMASGNALQWRELTYMAPTALGHFKEDPPPQVMR